MSLAIYYNKYPTVIDEFKNVIIYKKKRIYLSAHYLLLVPAEKKIEREIDLFKYVKYCVDFH